MASRKGSHHSKGGFREDIQIYVRSSWEANYGRYLNWLKEKGKIRSWEYESETFEFPVKRGSIDYKPDFKVTYPDGRIEFHEVKGYLTQTGRTKLKRMAKYYPDVKIVLIDKTVYADLSRIFKNVLPGWEQGRQ